MSDGSQPFYSVALVAYIEKQAKRYLTNLKAVLSGGEVSAVHDVRVASRRLEEPLRIAETWLGERPLEKTVRRLKRTRRALRRVRDLDVLLASLCGSSAPPGLDAKDLAQLEGALTNQRERGLRKARRRFRRLESSRAAGKVRRLAAVLQDSVGASDEDRLGEHIEQLFHTSLARLRDRDPRANSAADLHQTRIVLKRLRYATELRRDVCGLDEPELHKALVGMQDLLGYWNDQLSAVRVIARLARRERTLSDDAGWCARLLEHCAHRGREADAARTRILEHWSEFAGRLQAYDASRVTPVAAETTSKLAARQSI